MDSSPGVTSGLNPRTGGGAFRRSADMRSGSLSSS